MGEWIVLGVCFLVFGLFLAVFEIEIEGEKGWAAGLPTWSRKKGPISRRYFKGFGSRPLTGYHLMFFPFVLGVWGLIYHWWWVEIHGQAWQGQAWWLMVSLGIALCATWDFMWFPLNPHFGMAKFRKEFIWWHEKDWWVFGKFPSAYLWAFLGAMLFGGLGAFLSEDAGMFTGLLMVLAVVGIGVVLTVFVLVRPYQWWYHRMRQPEE